MVPNGVICPSPKITVNTVTSSHTLFFSLVPFSLSFFFFLLFFHHHLETFCLKFYLYLIIFRLICRDTGNVHGGKESGRQRQAKGDGGKP